MRILFWIAVYVPTRIARDRQFLLHTMNCADAAGFYVQFLFKIKEEAAEKTIELLC
jgi:hypothetical protein